MKLSRIFQAALAAAVLGNGTGFAQEAPQPAASTSAAAPKDPAVDELVEQAKAVIPTDWTEEKINAIPKRDFTFEDRSDVFVRRTANPAFYGKAKFVASFSAIVLPHSGDSWATRNSLSLATIELSEISKEAYLLTFQGDGGQGFLPHNFGNVFGRNRGFGTVRPDYTALIRQVPKDILLPEELTYLQSANLSDSFTANQGVRPRGPSSATSRDTEEVAILEVFAPTLQETKLRITALLKLCDYGYTRPMQLALLHDRQTYCVKLEEQLLARKTIQAELSKLVDEAKTLPAVSAEDHKLDLNSLRFQIDVEIAGCKARLREFEKKLATGLKESTVTQLEGFQAAAEIELIGLEVRAAMVKEQIEKVNAFNTAFIRNGNLQNKLQTASMNVQNTISIIKLFDQELARFAPLKLVDNKIYTSPFAAVEETRERQ